MTKLILDVDSVGDDILAILYGALHPDMEIKGITTVCGASGSIEQATNVALHTLCVADRSDIPVYAGAAGPLKPANTEALAKPVNFEKELYWKFGERLNKFNEQPPAVKTKAQTKSAADFMVESFNSNPGEIVLVTTGPLTNVAKALENNPEMANNVKHAYILGGCFHAPGNISPVSEYNIWADAEAAKCVFNSGMSITLVPLDVCENNKFAAGMMTRDHLFDLNEYGKRTKVIDFVTEKFPVYIDIWREFFGLGGFPMDDVITLALAADESLCGYTENVFVDVETEGAISRGQTVAYFGRQIFKTDEKQKNTRIANTLDGRRFMDLFVKTIM